MQVLRISCAGLKSGKVFYFLVEKPDKGALVSKNDFKICENYFMVGSGLFGDFQELMRNVRKEVNIHITCFDEISEKYVSNVVFKELAKFPPETEVLFSGLENMYHVSKETGIIQIKKGYAIGQKKELAMGIIDSFNSKKKPEQELLKIQKLWNSHCHIFSTE